MQKTSKKIKFNSFEILFALLVSARASAFLFNKLLITHIGVMTLMAVRFLTATFLLFLLSPSRILHSNRKTVLGGAVLGVVFWGIMVCEMYAIREADTSLVSVLEHTAVVMVPLAEGALSRKMPSVSAFLGSLLAFAGIFCIGISSGSMSGSIGLSLLAAVFYTADLILTKRVTTTETDAISIGVVQLFVMGLLSLLSSFLLEPFSLPRGTREILMFLYLVFVCTVFGYTLTPYAQSKISVERAGIIAAVNPAVTTLLGVIVLGESFSFLAASGIVLILLSLLLPYLPLPGRKDR